MSENRMKLVLFLSEDVIFKPMLLKIVLQLVPAEEIAGVVECGSSRKKKTKKTSPITEWGLYGAIFIAAQILAKKALYFFCKRLSIDNGLTLKSFCKKTATPYLYSRDINGPETEDFCQKSEPNIAVSFQHQKIKPPLMQLFSHGIFNIHPSQLPKYRGVKPIHWAAYHQEPFFAVSLHSVGEQFDTGEVWLSRNVFLRRENTFFDYYRISNQIAAFLIADLLSNFSRISKMDRVKSEASHPYYSAPDAKIFAELRADGWRMF